MTDLNIFSKKQFQQHQMSKTNVELRMKNIVGMKLMGKFYLQVFCTISLHFEIYFLSFPRKIVLVLFKATVFCKVQLTFADTLDRYFVFVETLISRAIFVLQYDYFRNICNAEFSSLPRTTNVTIYPISYFRQALTQISRKIAQISLRTFSKIVLLFPNIF